MSWKSLLNLLYHLPFYLRFSVRLLPLLIAYLSMIPLLYLSLFYLKSKLLTIPNNIVDYFVYEIYVYTFLIFGLLFYLYWWWVYALCLLILLGFPTLFLVPTLNSLNIVFIINFINFPLMMYRVHQNLIWIMTLKLTVFVYFLHTRPL